jgi:hypothetical protein
VYRQDQRSVVLLQLDPGVVGVQPGTSRAQQRLERLSRGFGGMWVGGRSGVNRHSTSRLWSATDLATLDDGAGSRGSGFVARDRGRGTRDTFIVAAEHVPEMLGRMTDT